MPFDNIASVDAIQDIVCDIMKDAHMEKFLRYKTLGDKLAEDFFLRETGHMSDIFIEIKANDYIEEYIL
jgi:hypothetical protein